MKHLVKIVYYSPVCQLTSNLLLDTFPRVLPYLDFVT